MPTPEIVILDAYATNPGDLSWNSLATLGKLKIYEHCPQKDAEIIHRCSNASIVLTNKIAFTATLLNALPKLELIIVQGTGYNHIDIATAKKCGIAVCNVPGYSTDSVAQHTFALLLELFSKVNEYDTAIKAGTWQHSPDATFYINPLFELAGKTLGIFGFGAIGQKVGRIAAAFGMKILYHCRTPKQLDFASYITLPQLLAESDIISLHAPLTPETALVVNRENISKMKQGAYLINTARGGLVDEMALADALNTGYLAGAAIDVTTQEPPSPDCPLLHAKHCIFTPHIAWATRESRQRLITAMAQNIQAFLEGDPIHRVNP